MWSPTIGSLIRRWGLIQACLIGATAWCRRWMSGLRGMIWLDQGCTRRSRLTGRWSGLRFQRSLRIGHLQRRRYLQRRRWERWVFLLLLNSMVLYEIYLKSHTPPLCAPFSSLWWTSFLVILVVAWWWWWWCDEALSEFYVWFDFMWYRCGEVLKRFCVHVSDGGAVTKLLVNFMCERTLCDIDVGGVLCPWDYSVSFWHLCCFGINFSLRNILAQ